MRKAISALLISALFLTGCGKEEDNTTPSFYSYLGGYSYDAPVTAFVYESVAGEEEYGIQYREVTDLEGLLASDDTVMIYMYDSLSQAGYGITAGAEDIAQCTWDDMLVVMVDVQQNIDLATKYGVDKVPEFIIVRSGSEVSRFAGYNYEEWTMSDVAVWVSSCGIRVDYSKIN